jgi:hypothetical protein
LKGKQKKIPIYHSRSTFIAYFFCFGFAPDISCCIIFKGIRTDPSKTDADIPVYDGKDCDDIGIMKTKSEADHHEIPNSWF